MMLLIQGIGVAALLLDIGSVQCKYRKHILVVQILASLLWVGHFFLLGATAGAAMNFVGLVRSASYYKWRGTRRTWWVPGTIILLSVVVTVVTWQGITSLLPMFAMILAAIAFWQRAEQTIRFLLLCAAPFWLIYNVIYHSYAGIASDILAVISISLALYRYRRQGFVASGDSKHGAHSIEL